MSDRGAEIFADELTRFAAEVPDPQVAAIAARVAAPLRVAVCGRRGVGRRTVARALGCAGLTVRTRQDAEVVVYVVAEAVKPEDAAAVAAMPQPALVVLNKADLGGHAAVTDVSARLGATVEPMSGLLAVAALDTGPDGAQVAALRGLSRIDAVVARIDAVGAAAHYRRISAAVADLEALAVADDRIGTFLSRDATVFARMAAAARVVEAAGAPGAGRAVSAAGHLSRAIRWQRYSRGPVNVVHRACGIDIARGELRLWAAARQPEAPWEAR